MYRPFDRFHPEEKFISVIGSGGKTTLLQFLASRLPGTVILTTSTHMFPFPGLPLVDTSRFSQGDAEGALAAIRGVLAEERVVVAGCLNPSGKLSSPEPVLPFSVLAAEADHCIVEADGAAGRPLKAHRSFEPVIPSCSGLTIAVAGASGLGRPAGEACHCPEIFCAIAGITPDTAVEPEHVARVLNRESLADCYLINQADVLPSPEKAVRLCDLLQKDAYVTSLISGMRR